MNFPLKLVEGGETTFKSGNHSKEFEHELKAVLDTKGFTKFTEKTVIKDLENLSMLNWNIVGTRGYVYYIPNLLRIAKSINDPERFQWNLFPRSVGLREAVMDLYGVDKQGWF